MGREPTPPHRRLPRPPSGVVFTPAPLAEAAERRLAALAPPGATLLDPACGDGALLAAGANSGHWGALHGMEQAAEHARRARERVRGARVEQVDALAASSAWPAGAWILANPPWVSFSGRQAARHTAAAGHPSAAQETKGWPSLHGAFLERIGRHVAEHGTAAVVLAPASLTELEGYSALRRRLARWVRPGAVRELGERAFPGVVGPAVELLLLPTAEAGQPEVHEPDGGWSSGSPLGRQLQAAFARFPRLPARSFADPGVHSGNSAALIVRPVDEPAHAPLAQGRDLVPYRLGPASARLRTDLTPTREQRFRIAALEHYTSFPILLRQTANRPLAALHEPRGYFRNSLLACRAVAGLDAAFVVAVLNAATAAAWHRARFRDARQRAFPQVKVGHLDTQPFPIAHRNEDPRLHDELARRVATLAPGSVGFEREQAAIERLVIGAFRLEPGARELLQNLA